MRHFRPFRPWRYAHAIVDGYTEAAAPSGPIDLGVHEAREGKFLVRVEVVGTNAASTGEKYYFGLDAFVLSPVVPAKKS